MTDTFTNNLQQTFDIDQPSPSNQPQQPNTFVKLMLIILVAAHGFLYTSIIAKTPEISMYLVMLILALILIWTVHNANAFKYKRYSKNVIRCIAYKTLIANIVGQNIPGYDKKFLLLINSFMDHQDVIKHQKVLDSLVLYSNSKIKILKSTDDVYKHILHYNKYFNRIKSSKFLDMKDFDVILKSETDE